MIHVSLNLMVFKSCVDLCRFHRGIRERMEFTIQKTHILECKTTMKRFIFFRIQQFLIVELLLRQVLVPTSKNGRIFYTCNFLFAARESEAKFLLLLVILGEPSVFLTGVAGALAAASSASLVDSANIRDVKLSTTN